MMSPRAAKVCSSPSCPNLQPCPDHTPKAWQGSRRKDRTTLSGSAQQKRARFVLRKHNAVCHICGEGGATEADHVIPLSAGGADTIENMRPAHVECHKRKTQAEAQAARNHPPYA